MNISRDLELELLRTFVAVVDGGGFTRAAERMHRTQSTVSQQLRRLEERLATEGMCKKQRAAVRRLAYSAWLAALGLVTMLGVAESAGDPLVHKDSDLVETLAGVFNAAAESLGAQKTG